MEMRTMLWWVRAKIVKVAKVAMAVKVNEKAKVGEDRVSEDKIE